MKSRGIQVAAVLTAGMLVAVLAATACAQPGAATRGEPGARLVERLGLSPEQAESLNKLREEGEGERLVLRKEVIRLRHALQGEMLADQPDPGKVAKLSAEIGDAQAKLRTNRLRHQIELRKLLTPEQRDRMLTMRQGGGHRGRGHGHGICPQGRGDGPGQARGRGAKRGPRMAPLDGDI